MVAEFLANHNRIRHIHIRRSHIQPDNNVDTYRAVPVTNPNHLLIIPLLDYKVKLPHNPARTLKDDDFTFNFVTFFLKVSNRAVYQTLLRWFLWLLL